MGYLAHTLVALFAQGLHEVGLTLDVRAPWAVLALAFVPVLLARLARRDALAGRFGRADLLYALQNASPPALFLVASTCLGWQRSTAAWLGRDASVFDWPHPLVALSFLPYVLYGLVAIDARVRSLDTRAEEVARSRRFHVRMFLSTFVPLGLYVLLAFGVASNVGLRARIEYVGLYGAGFALLIVALFLGLLPTLLTWTWDTQPLRAGPLRSVLESLARAAGFRCREILLWRTGGRMANAAVVGVLPRLRVVMLSDALLSQLSVRETLAVFAHEVGHARRHHVAVFLCWTLGFFLGVDLLVTGLGLEDELAGFGVLAAGLGLWYLGFGWMSRRFELDADLYSVELLGDPEAMIGALERVGGPHGRSRKSWRHFSTGRRVDFLRNLAFQPRAGRELRGRLRVMAAFGLLLATVVLGLQFASLLADLPEDRVVAELALGRYDEARARLEEVEGADEGLRRRVQRALALSSEGGANGASVARLEAAALEAMRAGDDLAASELLELAYLRGADELADAGRALADEAAGRAVEPERWRSLARSSEPLRPDWARALAARAGAQ